MNHSPTKAIERRVIVICILLLGLIGLNHTDSNTTLSTPADNSFKAIVENPVQAANPEDCQLSNAFTAEVRHWKPYICRWSREHSMDPDLIATIMQIESCGNSTAVSATGVRGLFQVTGANLDGQNPFDPNVSMAKGPGKVLKYELQQADGNITAAMAGYNGGALARQWIQGKLSTNDFIYRLRTSRAGYWRTLGKARAKVNEVAWYAQWANIYHESKQGKQDTLKKWLDMGGSHLCSRASVQLGLSQPSTPVVSSAEERKS